MSRKLLAVSLLILVSVGRPARGQETLQDPLLDHLTGQWVLQGTIGSQQTTHDVTAEWILNHEYIRIHEISREKDEKGRAAYEALVLLGWDAKLKQYACLWLDTTGAGGLVPWAILHGTRNGNEIALVLNDPDGSNFHTTFVYKQTDDTWQWLMDNEEKGKLQPFARLTLKRK